LARLSTIRRSFAGGLLLLFAFSITPKKPLHDFFAHHKDTPVKSSGDKTEQFSQAGFNCNCENLVVEFPFTASSFPEALIRPVVYRSAPYSRIIDVFQQEPPRYFALRGPPTL
jgi:hypothetical protein